ncbi:hypothetical protein E4K10_26070 [Streptomyces sp. T1317-0309]|nr:hypothetical protein E4K10_26070 [Streptomyces sp. T1317-0309]
MQVVPPLVMSSDSRAMPLLEPLVLARVYWHSVEVAGVGLVLYGSPRPPTAFHDATILLPPVPTTTSVPLARPFMTYCVVSEPTAARVR